jgi:hypothetical protein
MRLLAMPQQMTGSQLPWPFSESLPSLRGPAQLVRVYNRPVNELAHFAMHVLTVLFFIGLAGSSIVVVISFVEDLTELIGD